MSTIYKNSGLRLSMESAREAADTITAITNASPGVVTATAHGFSDGDIVLLEVGGMNDLNKRAFKVIESDTNTFQLADETGLVGIDTTNFGTFTSGTATKVTLGISITGTQGFAPSGGDGKLLDTTTVQDTNDTQETNGTTAISYALTQQWDPADTAQRQMIEFNRSGVQKVFRFQWPNGTFVLFYGSVAYSGAPGGDNQGITTSTATVALGGRPTYSK
jgi:hypothetical protein